MKNIFNHRDTEFTEKNQMVFFIKLCVLSVSVVN
jgi:hypothetical protein